MSPRPAFSVIVPTRDRPAALAECLRSFQAIDYPAGEWEIILVNDGGVDPEQFLAGDAVERLPLRAHSIERSGPAAARNYGASQARGEIVAFTDDDCQVEPDWLLRLLEGFESGPWDALGGRTLNPYPDMLGSRCNQYLLDFMYAYASLPEGDAYFLVSNNAAYRRSTFEALGGFDEGFPGAAAEDRELSHRLVAAGHRQAYWPMARVWHHHRLSAWGYIRLQFGYGVGDDYFRQALAKLGLPRKIGQRRRPQFHLALAQSLWRDRSPADMWLLLAVSQLAHFSGSRWQRLQRLLKSE